MATFSVCENSVCVRWTTEKMIPVEEETHVECESPVFYFESVGYYLSLRKNYDFYDLSIKTLDGSTSSCVCNCSVHVEDQSGKIIPELSRVNKNFDLSERLIEAFYEWDILQADPDFFPERIIRFLIILDTAVDVKPNEKRE